MTETHTDVSRETVDELELFWARLLHWNQAVGLTGPTPSEAGWRRHIQDSIQLSDHFPSRSLTHCDLGSGGGLPAIPISLLRRSMGFDDELVMFEANARKAVFLRTVSAELGLAPLIVTVRIESACSLKADVVTARALAPLVRLLDYVYRHMEPRGLAVLPKGRRASDEVVNARRQWAFDVVTHPSRTAPDASVLVVSNVKRLEARDEA